MSFTEKAPPGVSLEDWYCFGCENSDHQLKDYPNRWDTNISAGGAKPKFGITKGNANSSVFAMHEKGADKISRVKIDIVLVNLVVKYVVLFGCVLLI